MSILATAMQPLINQYEIGGLDKNEILFSRYGAHDLFMRQNTDADAILSPANRKQAQDSYGNVKKIPVMNGVGVSIGNSRSCTVGDAESTSALVTLNFTPLVWGFTMYPAQYVTNGQPMNYIGHDADFKHKVDQCNLALMSTVDVLARNSIETNKNTYWLPSVISSYYPEVGDALQVTQAQKNDMFNQLSAVMMEFDFYNTIDILGSTSLKPLTTRLEAQGIGNSTNEQFQFQLGGFIFTSSNRVTSGTGVQATFYAIQKATLAVVNRNNPTANGNFTVGSSVVEWGKMNYPWLGLEVGTFYKEECAVSAGAVTDTATLKQSYQWDTEICYFTAYNSSPSTKQSSIIKVEVSAS